MPTRAALVEDDAHRVLQLVRGACRPKANATATARGKPTARLKTVEGHGTAGSTWRHRHEYSNASTPPASLAQAKTRALMAVYGLRHTLPPSGPRQDNRDNNSNNDDDEGGADDDADAQRTRRELLAARRRTYRDHFSGLQATYGPSGRPKLETLIDAAMDAKRSGSAKHTALAVGAAVLTSTNRIYAAARVESAQDSKFDVCAERAALLKLRAQPDADAQVVEALVVCSDQRGLLPVPCGSCREFLAEFGDFPVFLLNAENDARETRSFELFPLARHATYTAMATQHAAEATRNLPRHHAGTIKCEATTRLPEEARDWTCEQVAAWVRDVVELPQYAPVFADKRVDGATLWLLKDTDLQLLLGIVHPLHRRRVLLHLDRLRDRALLEHGVDFAQLADYVAVLDRDRLEVVAQLKQTFDRLDANHDGRLDAAELARAMRALGLDASQALAAQQLVAQIGERDDGVTFPRFVETFTQLAQLPAGETRDATTSHNSVPAVDLETLRDTFDRADTNGSGALDEREVAELLRSLGRDDCERRAREWFSAAVDTDGDAKLSVAEFFLRYAQLTKLDLSVVRGVFDDASRAGARRQCSVDEAARALHKLFPHADASDVRAWCLQRPWATGQKRTKTVAFADFALASVMYGNALRLRVEQLARLQQSLRTSDALCHRSRIVQLQRSGHVRLCTHPGGDSDQRGQGEVALGEKRRRQLKTETSPPSHKRHSDDDDDGEGKVNDSDNEEDERRDGVVATFDRFARKQKREETKTSHSRTRGGARSRRANASDDDQDDDDGKRQHSDEEDDASEATLNAVEAAQALLELGVAWSRDQVVRFLDREGFGLRRAIRRRDFVRIFTRLRAMQRATRTASGRDAHKELWEAIGGGQPKAMSPRKATRTARPVGKDYDAYLRDKHAQQKRKNPSKSSSEVLRGRRRHRDDDMARARSRRSSSDSSTSESSGDDRNRKTRSRRRAPSNTRRSSRSTSTASSSSSSPHCSPRRRSRSKSHSRGHSRGRQRDSDRFFRGFEVGDRVVCRVRGAGTLVRLYRDYFVADVRFDSGESAKNIELSHLKRLPPDASSTASVEAKHRALFVVGTPVRVAHKRTRAAWRRGTIQQCRSDGTFDVVANECGEQELLTRVPLAQLALVGKPVVYSTGAHVTVKRRREYLRGTVAMCRTNGTYDVRVRGRGGEVLREVAWELLAPDEADGDNDDDDDDDDGNDDDDRRKKKPTARGGRRKDDDEVDEGKANDDDEDAFEPEFSVGDRVEARFQGQAAYYSGRVTRVHRDGACDIAYDDGDAETRVRASLIRALAKSAAPKHSTKASHSKRDHDGYDDDFESD